MAPSESPSSIQHNSLIIHKLYGQTFREVDRAVLDGEAEGFLKVWVQQGSDRIIGVTLVTSHASEMISELTMAIAGGIGLTTIARTIHPCPTQDETIRKIADAYNRMRLTPRVNWLLRK
jgi:pyruvate/2-oxoglutarate dehydrogenase complex dihydrolipoamide dehydrogenase (E3) component